MFGWFKKKPEHVEPDPPRAAAEAVAEAPEVIDDWGPRHGNWFRATFCHCGYQRPERKDSASAVEVDLGVCPWCGHDSKWESYTARWEWEHSQTIRIDWFRTGCFNYPDKEHERPWSRNAKLVRWTEDHCQIKEDQNENS